jgi:uncharacterized membrane protein
MKSLGTLMVKGLLAILPLGLTVYVVYWFGVTTESLLSDLLRFVLPESLYLPGMGLVAGILVLLFVGVLVNAYLVRRLLDWGENQLLRVPVVKTVYAAIRDLTGLMKVGGSSGELKRVVMVELSGARLLGFVTQENAEMPGLAAAESLVAVYLPMSYQIGGYTVYVPRERIEPTDLTVEAAMRIVLTGGLQTQ